MPPYANGMRIIDCDAKLADAAVCIASACLS